MHVREKKIKNICQEREDTKKKIKDVRGKQRDDTLRNKELN